MTVPDSDEEHRSPAKGHHPRQQHYSNQSYLVREIKPEPASVQSFSSNSSSSNNNNNSSSSSTVGGGGASSMSQKKRLLAKAQGECMIGKPKQELPDVYSVDYTNERSNVPCDFSSSSDAGVHHHPPPQQQQQQQQQQQPPQPPQPQPQRSYRHDYQDHHRDYLHPPAAHRQQRDAEHQQHREQNGYYSNEPILLVID